MRARAPRLKLLAVEAEVACRSTSAEAYLLRHRMWLQCAGQKHGKSKGTPGQVQSHPWEDPRGLLGKQSLLERPQGHVEKTPRAVVERPQGLLERLQRPHGKSPLGKTPKGRLGKTAGASWKDPKASWKDSRALLERPQALLERPMGPLGKYTFAGAESMHIYI